MRSLIGLLLVLHLITGCATYITPGAGVNVSNLAAADDNIAYFAFSVTRYDMNGFAASHI